MPETAGQRFRRLGDELRELTGGEHYFSGEQGTPRLYLFSFGAYADATEAQAELDRRLTAARETRKERDVQG